MQPDHRAIPSMRLLCRAIMIAGAIVFAFAVAEDVLARVGGGGSYGGGGRSGGGGSGGDGGGGGALVWVILQLFRLLIYLTIEYPLIGIPLDLLVAGCIVYYFVRRARRVEPATPLGLNTQQTSLENIPRQFDQLRKFDPNFSEIVFTDFAYALYGKAHDARGRGAAALDQFSPYLSDVARANLLQRNPAGLKDVKGIIVGSLNTENVSGLETPLVRISLMFEANYTEVVNVNQKETEMSYYVRERWELERKRDVLSPPPAQATALHCPRCGGALQKNSAGACAFCGAKIESGEFQWYVHDVSLLNREARGPLLTSNVPEVGTDFPSVVQPGFENVRVAFEKNNPTFSWGAFQARARLIFDELQAAWSTLNWDRARPHETDDLFQMHQYWIEAYRRQHLRNLLDQCTITAMQPVKITEDKFYNSITVRIGAQGYDYTVDDGGRVVSGSKTQLRRWTEYWTFIRNRDATPQAARSDLNCPNCAAPLRVNAAGICEFCGGKITSGEFDWVLSRIEQDESYQG